MEFQFQLPAEILVFKAHQKIVLDTISNNFQDGDEVNPIVILNKVKDVNELLKVLDVPAIIKGTQSELNPSELSIDTYWEPEYAEKMKKHNIILQIQ